MPPSPLPVDTSMDLAALRARWPLVIDVPIAWGDMDAFQHVNNTVYLRLFESARIALFARCGVMEHMEATGQGPILAETRCRFRRPMRYPDTASVGVRVEHLQAGRFLTRYVIISHAGDHVAAEGDGQIVFYDYEAGRKAALSEALARDLGTFAVDAGDLSG